MSSSLAIHFRRPSPYCEVWPVSESSSSLDCQIASKKLAVNLNVMRMAPRLYTAAFISEESLENHIPKDFRVHPGSTHLNLSSATLYMALHPLFTSKDSTRASEIISSKESMQLCRTIANSAVAIIEHLSYLNKDRKLINMWTSTEEVFGAGAVLASYIIHLRQSGSMADISLSISTSSAMDPLLKCATLLSSFAERWKGAKIYVQLWEALLILAWEFWR